VYEHPIAVSQAMSDIDSKTHLILIPSYNTGKILVKTVQETLKKWQPVWVVIDGSSDHSDELLKPLEDQFPDALQVFRLTKNSGKGAAVLHGIQLAYQQGYTHVLTMDADYQHPTEAIADFMLTSIKHSEAMILGEPVFDATAPALRVQGRKISNTFANVETLGWGIHDSLFGMRIYPIPALIQIMEATRWARRFDFETEVAVKLAWLGIPAINLATPVRYLSEQEGGVSQFRYFRDNTLLTWMHIRLLLGFIIRLPKLLFRFFR
jgi:glycosyltransferase involved in cell wall biosynthesis